VGPLARLDAPAQLRAVLSLKPKDFYCCITSRPALRALIGPAIVDDVYRPVQTRMQFNRWHFICGSFPESDVPRDRHYFYPPLTPDLAEWSDVWHAGHTRAGVRYSVRVPGPDMSLGPLYIGGHPYRGFYDVRVVRVAGEPFTLDDLLVVRLHCLWMGALWRRLVADGSVAISGFTAGDGFEAPDE